MQQRPYTVSIARGEGLVARFGEVVMYIADTSAAAAPLIAAAESVSETEYPGAAIAERLAIIAFHAGSAQAFGVVAPTRDGLLVLLRGNVAAQVDGADGAHEFSGAGALTWVDEIVPTGIETVVVRVGAASGVVGCAKTDLRAGVVPGGGFVLEHVGAATDQAHEPEVVAPQTMMRLAPIQGAAPPANTAVAQVVSPAETAAARVVSPAETAAAKVVPPRRPPSEKSTLAPAVGALVSQDEEIYPLDRAYVIGRDPQINPAVRDAQASPIVVHNDRHISRVHAYVTIDDDAVFVRDAGTPGGTYIAPPGANKWTQIGTKPTELKPGWSIQLGEQILTYRVGDRP